MQIGKEERKSQLRKTEEKVDELDNIELLFRMNSKGLTDEEKEVFRKELIEFMEERKKMFTENKK